jgi:hypothetical protein
MTAVAFVPSRADGRSDRQVVYEIISRAEPATVITFEVIQNALAEGLDHPVDRQRASAAMRQANRTLLRENQRTVVAVRRVGYRVINASEHRSVAIVRKERAGRQLRDGLMVMKQCRLDEMTENERKMHEGTTLMMSAVVSAVDYLDHKQRKQQKAIEALTARVERLEVGQ